MSLDQAPLRLLRRRAASHYLQSRWAIRAAEQTLAKYAVKGSGPEFRLYSRDVVYDAEKLDEWARSRLSKPVRSTSETHLSTPSSLGECHCAHNHRIHEREAPCDCGSGSPESAREDCGSKACLLACKCGAGPP